jgi:hypothetical protein
VGYLAIRFLLGFLAHHSLRVFACYRFALAPSLQGRRLPSEDGSEPTTRTRWARISPQPYDLMTAEATIDFATAGDAYYPCHHAAYGCQNSYQRVYNPAAMPPLRRAQLALLAALVAAFVGYYPLLYGDPGGCPEASQSSHAIHLGSSVACIVAVLAASFMAPTVASLLGGRRATNQRRPAEVRLSPDPCPLRPLL